MSDIIIAKRHFYEGKANRLYDVADRDDVIVIERKDDVSAGNGERRGSILGKGRCNNYVSNYLFQLLETEGVHTHFLEEIDETRTLIRKLSPIKLEVIVRNYAAGSLCRRFPTLFTEGQQLDRPIYELTYKDDELGDPFITEDMAYCLGIASFKELEHIRERTLMVNHVLCNFFDKLGIILADFKVEYGRDANGIITLMDELSPDTCRLWDKETRRKLDKDLFRQDLGGEEEAYREIYERVKAYAASYPF